MDISEKVFYCFLNRVVDCAHQTQKDIADFVVLSFKLCLLEKQIIDMKYDIDRLGRSNNSSDRLAYIAIIEAGSLHLSSRKFTSLFAKTLKDFYKERSQTNARYLLLIAGKLLPFMIVDSEIEFCVNSVYTGLKNSFGDGPGDFKKLYIQANKKIKSNKKGKEKFKKAVQIMEERIIQEKIISEYGEYIFANKSKAVGILKSIKIQTQTVSAKRKNSFISAKEMGINSPPFKRMGSVRKKSKKGTPVLRGISSKIRKGSINMGGGGKSGVQKPISEKRVIIKKGYRVLIKQNSYGKDYQIGQRSRSKQNISTFKIPKKPQVMNNIHSSMPPGMEFTSPKLPNVRKRRRTLKAQISRDSEIDIKERRATISRITRNSKNGGKRKMKRAYTLQEDSLTQSELHNKIQSSRSGVPAYKKISRFRRSSTALNFQELHQQPLSQQQSPLGESTLVNPRKQSCGSESPFISKKKAISRINRVSQQTRKRLRRPPITETQLDSFDMENATSSINDNE